MLPWIDIAIIVVYMIVSVGFGCWFYFASRSPEGFTSANGRAPGIIVGLSIFGTYVSSISFLALPGKAFVGNWNAYGLSLSIPLAAWIATKWFVPFYRNIGSISAYAHLEDRFGPWARVYASGCYLLTQVARMGSVLFLLALPLHHLLGWDVRWIIIVVGASAALYSMIGGITGILWTDALQSVVLIVGALTCALILVFQMPEGPRQLFEIAQANDKFSLGSFSVTDFCSSTFWVVLLYGLTINLQNFGIDQNYVQRYLTSPTERQAKNSVWLGALLYLPISAFFFFIGTALFAFYTAQPDLIIDPQLAADVAAGKGDGVFPYFIVHQLPVGMTGLLIAAILAAAMSTISSNADPDGLLQTLFPSRCRGERTDAGFVSQLARLGRFGNRLRLADDFRQRRSGRLLEPDGHFQRRHGWAVPAGIPVPPGDVQNRSGQRRRRRERNSLDDGFPAPIRNLARVACCVPLSAQRTDDNRLRHCRHSYNRLRADDSINKT